MKNSASVNPEEIAKFEAMADEWWSETGKFAPLHKFNPVRIGYIRDQLSGIGSQKEKNLPITDYRSLITILDIGCGGGLLAEPLARLGYNVTGIDASEKNIRIAQLHAEQGGVNVDYQAISAEELAATGAQFDMVCAMEVIEHVADVEGFLKAAASMVKPGGLLLVATLNRTPKSFALAIVGAEYILRWLPKGTHDWKKFLKPSEIAAPVQAAGLMLRELKGAVYNPLKGSWSLSEDVSVNYMLLAERWA